MGRPLKDIDGDEVFRLASTGCTQAEIAGKFGVHQSTISRRFASEYEQGLAECKTSLRHYQWERARNGSDAMLIHLGKVYLGQADRIDVTSGGKTMVPYEVGNDGRDPGIPLPVEAEKFPDDSG